MTRQTMIDTLMANSGITASEAVAVADYYCRLRIVTYNNHDLYQLKHGVYFEGTVIRQALIVARNNK